MNNNENDLLRSNTGNTEDVSYTGSVNWGESEETPDGQNAGTNHQEEAEPQRRKMFETGRPVFISGQQPKKRGRFKKRWVILIIIVLLLLLRACSGGDKKQENNETKEEAEVPVRQEETADTAQTEAEEETQDIQKEVRDGFDPETNLRAAAGGFVFQIPSYYTEQTIESSGRTVYRAGKGNEAQIMFSEMNDAFTSEMFDKRKEIIAEGFTEGIDLGKMEVLCDESRSFSGVQGYYRTVRGLLSGEDDVTIYNAFLLKEDTGNIVVASLVETAGSEYLYENDFLKCVDSVTEEAAAEEADTGEADTGEAETEEAGESAESGIDPAFKEAMDSYEAFIDEYVEFMNTYANSDDPTALLTQYAEYMTKYADVMKKLEAMETEDMTAEESAYYLEVMARINKKLLDAIS